MPANGPVPQPLAAEDLMQRIYEHLTPFVQTAEKGFLSIARDPLEIIEQLGQAPGRFRVILNWAGEKPVEGTHRDTGVVVHEFNVVVSHNRGLGIIKGGNLFLARGDDKPLITLCGNVRDLLRSLRFPARVTDEILTYAGTDPVAVDGTQIDAFNQTWRLTAALPRPQG